MKLSVMYLGKKGAGNIYTYEMAKGLLSSGCNLQVILSSYIDNKDDFVGLAESYKDKVEVLFVNTYRGKFEFLLQSLNICKFLWIAFRVNRYGPDCLYFPMLSVWVSFIIPFISKKIRIVSTIHDVSMHLGEYNRFLSSLGNYAIRKSDGVVTLTSSFVQEISSVYSIPENNIVWIRHANYLYYRRWMRSDAKNEIYRRILFFGRVHEYKGISVLLDAMSLVKKENPRIKLRIVGRGNLCEDDQIKMVTLGESVEYINRWVDDSEVHKYFSDIDFLVAPYIEASQSGVVMLSYAFSKPVIVTNVGGLPEQVVGESGRVIPANNPKELAEAILSMYEDEPRLLGMYRYIDSLNKTIFSWEKSVQDLLTFIRHLPEN